MECWYNAGMKDGVNLADEKGLVWKGQAFSREPRRTSIRFGQQVALNDDGKSGEPERDHMDLEASMRLRYIRMRNVELENGTRRRGTGATGNEGRSDATDG